MAPRAPDWLRGLYTRYTRVSDNRDARETNGLVAGQLSSGGKAPATPNTLMGQVKAEFKAFFLDTKLNVLLAALPVAVVARVMVGSWGEAPLFVFACLALCPLAERLGFVTEQLAMFTNDTLGGLLNASFGNATEVIISGFALQKGYLRVVQLSLLGSVVSNLLLVMGTAFLAGGIKHATQTFNQQGASVNCALLLLGTVAVILPSLLSNTSDKSKEDSSELGLSRFISVFMLLLYGCYLVFQLVTHRFLYEDGAQEGASKAAETSQPDQPLQVNAMDTDDEADLESRVAPQAVAPPTLSRISSNRYQAVELTSRGPKSDSERGERTASGRPVRSEIEAMSIPINVQDYHSDREKVNGGAGHGGQAGSDHGDDDEEDELVLSKVGCFLWLASITVLIAVLSEWIMDAITEASHQLKIPMPFLVTIVLPIVGNAAEHASAIVFAWKNRMEIALGVAVGSSTQVAVLIVPFCVVLGWMMGRDLDLNCNEFECVVYFLSVLLAIITVQDGTANWLKGALLLVTYVLVAAGFWMHKDPFLHEGVDDAR